MITRWSTGTVSATTSTDPGVSNVTTGIHYTINDVPLVGTRDAITNILNTSLVLEGATQTAVLTGASYAATLESE
jgi:hypothetical protein